MTYPGLGGQQSPPQNAAPAGQLVPGVQPGVSSQVVASRVIIIGTGGELLVYSPTAGAGTLTASIAAAATTDQYGNHIVQGTASYGSGFATSEQAGIIQFYTGSLAGGWTTTGSITTDSLGDIALLAAVGRQVITNNVVIDDGSGNLTANSGTFGALTVAGSTNTGSGNNGGVTSGPSGTVSAFPAAGPNHTHAEVHQHPF
jgi:hypothetical protein